MYSPSLHIDRSIDNFPYAPRNTWLGLPDFPCLFLFGKDKTGSILTWEKLILTIKNNKKKNFSDANCCNWRARL